PRMGGRAVSVALLLAAALTQAPDQQEKDAEAPLIAWNEAVACLRNPDRVQDARGHFREAARGYEHLCHQYGDNVYHLLWLGYSYHAAGDLPHAIAAYRRGLATDPGYLEFVIPNLRAALAHAREQVQYLPAPDLTRLLRPDRELWPPW